MSVEKQKAFVALLKAIKNTDIQEMKKIIGTPPDKALVNQTMDDAQSVTYSGTLLQEKGYPPLLVAIDQGNVEAVKLLVESGANIDWVSQGFGVTPLKRAMLHIGNGETSEEKKRNMLEIIKYLAPKADLELKTGALNQTALGAAESTDMPVEVKAILIDAYMKKEFSKHFDCIGDSGLHFLISSNADNENFSSVDAERFDILVKGFNLNEVNENNDTVFDYAEDLFKPNYETHVRLYQSLVDRADNKEEQKRFEKWRSSALQVKDEKPIEMTPVEPTQSKKPEKTYPELDDKSITEFEESYNEMIGKLYDPGFTFAKENIKIVYLDGEKIGLEIKTKNPDQVEEMEAALGLKFSQGDRFATLIVPNEKIEEFKKFVNNKHQQKIPEKSVEAVVQPKLNVATQVQEVPAPKVESNQDQKINGVLSFLLGKDNSKYQNLLFDQEFLEWLPKFIDKNKVKEKSFYSELEKLIEADLEKFQQWGTLAVELSNALLSDSDKRIGEAKEKIKDFLEKNPLFVEYFYNNKQAISGHQHDVITAWDIASRKNLLLIYLNEYRNKHKDKTELFNLLDRVVRSIKKDEDISYNNEEKKLLNSPPLSLELLSIVENNYYYNAIIPKSLKGVLAETRSFIKSFDTAYDKLKNKIDTALQPSEEDKRQLKMLEAFSKAIKEYDQSAKFSFEEICLIKDLIPKNISQYKDLLPENLKNIDNLLLSAALNATLNECKKNIHENNEISSASKNQLFNLFPKDLEKVPADSKVTNKIIAQLCDRYLRDKDKNSHLSQSIEDSLSELLGIDKKDIEAARLERESWGYYFFNSKEKKDDPVFKLITEKIRHLDEKDRKEIAQMVGVLRKHGNAAITLALSDKSKDTQKSDNVIQQYGELVEMASNENPPQVQAMLALKKAMADYLDEHPEPGLSHSRQARASYLGNLMDNSIKAYAKAPNDSAKEAGLKKVILELYLHYSSIKRESEISQKLERALIALLNIATPNAGRADIDNKVKEYLDLKNFGGYAKEFQSLVALSTKETKVFERSQVTQETFKNIGEKVKEVSVTAALPKEQLQPVENMPRLRQIPTSKSAQ